MSEKLYNIPYSHFAVSAYFFIACRDIESVEVSQPYPDECGLDLPPDSVPQAIHKKWCPFDKGQASPREHGAGTCLGPECMMWKFWVPPPGAGPVEATATREKHGKPDNGKKGYCGLSGVY